MIHKVKGEWLCYLVHVLNDKDQLNFEEKAGTAVYIDSTGLKDC